MSHHLPCLERREAVAGLVLGVLPAEEAAALREHLAECEACRAFHESLARQEGALEASFGRLAQGMPTRLALPAADDAEVAAAPIEPIGVGRNRSRRRRLRAVAAVAAGLLAVIGGLWLLSRPSGRDPIASTAQAGYSDVLRQIVRARSVRYTKTVEMEGHPPFTMEQMLLEGGRARTVVPGRWIRIDHYDTGEGLRLDPKRKTAERMYMVQPDRARLMDWPDWIRALHEQAGLCEGQQVLDGRVVDVYRVDRPYERITVWTDPHTHLPVRVETGRLPATDKDIRIPAMTLREGDLATENDRDRPASRPSRATTLILSAPGILPARQTIVLSDFAWNIDLDESLFDLTPPEGYTIWTGPDSRGAPVDERALLEALRFWAETSDGRFPEDINMLADAKPNLISKYRGSGPPDKAFDRAVWMMRAVLAGMFFAQTLKLEDNWHYAGKDVRLGEESKPLAWWLDKKILRWRVIYGDLTAKDLPRDQPPAMPGHEPPEPAGSPAGCIR